MGIIFRLGELGTRATSDLDISTRMRGQAFQKEFSERLAVGWGRVPPSKGALQKNPEAPERVAFTATIRAMKTHDPGLTRPEYVMHPYRVSIAFLGTSWGALDVEVSDPELGAGLLGRRQIDSELVEFGSYFGFGELQPVELVNLEYQIAQKIHAVTDPAYIRAHDLVDLQLLWNVGPDLNKLRDYCVRTFTWRKQQAWPPLPLREMNAWKQAYADAREETLINGNSAA